MAWVLKKPAIEWVHVMFVPCCMDHVVGEVLVLSVFATRGGGNLISPFRRATVSTCNSCCARLGRISTGKGSKSQRRFHFVLQQPFGRTRFWMLLSCTMCRIGVRWSGECRLILHGKCLQYHTAPFPPRVARGVHFHFYDPCVLERTGDLS